MIELQHHSSIFGDATVQFSKEDLNLIESIFNKASVRPRNIVLLETYRTVCSAFLGCVCPRTVRASFLLHARSRQNHNHITWIPVNTTQFGSNVNSYFFCDHIISPMSRRMHFQIRLFFSIRCTTSLWWKMRSFFDNCFDPFNQGSSEMAICLRFLLLCDTTVGGLYSSLSTTTRSETFSNVSSTSISSDRSGGLISLSLPKIVYSRNQCFWRLRPSQHWLLTACGQWLVTITGLDAQYVHTGDHGRVNKGLKPT